MGQKLLDNASTTVFFTIIVQGILIKVFSLTNLNLFYDLLMFIGVAFIIGLILSLFKKKPAINTK